MYHISLFTGAMGGEIWQPFTGLGGEQSWVTDPADTGEISRVTTQKANRVNRLKAIGNGQVPQCMVTAWEILTGNVS